MADDCVFYGIIFRKVPGSIAYEDSATMAFMELRQPGVGHIIVVPKRHIVDIFELDDATGSAVMATVAHIARAVRQALAPDGVSIWQSNGVAAGQEIFHLHVHILPRWANDGLFRVYPSRPGQPTQEELDGQAAAIRATLADR